MKSPRISANIESDPGAQFHCVEISVTREIRDYICLRFCMLALKAAETFSLDITNDHRVLKIGRAEDDKGVILFGPNEILIKLDQGQVGYAAYFLLEYVRDGVAQVDHIHLENPAFGQDRKQISHNADFTICVNETVEPMSAEEFEKRILRGDFE
jgi:hypothetical protein